MLKLRFILVFFIFLTLPVRARVFRTLYEGTDYRASGQIAYPWSGNLDGYLGYGFIFWGKKVTPPKKLGDVLYGYIRPNLRFQTSGVINRIETRLDLYPISFFGITLGQVFSHNALGWLGDASEKTGLDCNTVQCGGLLFRTFVEAKLKGGYEDYFGVLFWRADFLVNSGKKTQGFADFSSALVGGGRTDTLQTQWLKLGKKLPKNWSMGIHLEHNSMKKTRQHSYEEQIFTNYEFAPRWSVGGGVKAFQTPVDRFAWGIGLQVNWNGKTSVEL